MVKKTKRAPKKLLAHAHTGKIRHHQHTSYGSLALVLLLALLPLVSVSRAFAAVDMSGIESNYQTYAVVTGETPKIAPAIARPAGGQTFSSSDSIDVAGSCTGTVLVKIFKNDVLAGATLCQSNQYQVPIDLFVGINTLIARAYNSNDAASPDSTPVVVQLQLPTSNPASTSPADAPANQFYVTSELFHRGANAGDRLSWPIIISGGQAPYAVNVSWGDGESDLVSRGDASKFTLSHVYKKPADFRGSYKVVVKATDQTGANSFLQLVALVNTDPKAAGVINEMQSGYTNSSVVRFAWQGLAVAVVIVLSFWLGEQRELRLARRTGLRTV